LAYSKDLSRFVSLNNTQIWLYKCTFDVSILDFSPTAMRLSTWVWASNGKENKHNRSTKKHFELRNKVILADKCKINPFNQQT
jgi:hypothetical protein